MTFITKFDDVYLYHAFFLPYSCLYNIWSVVQHLIKMRAPWKEPTILMCRVWYPQVRVLWYNCLISFARLIMFYLKHLCAYSVLVKINMLDLTGGVCIINKGALRCISQFVPETSHPLLRKSFFKMERAQHSSVSRLQSSCSWMSCI